LEIRRELGNKITIAMLLHNLGYVALSQGEGFRAAALFKESLTLYREWDGQSGIAECLAGLAAAAAAEAEGEPLVAERAARLFGAAEALLEARGISLVAADKAEYGRYVAVVRSQLDEAALAAAWAEGRAMAAGGWEQAIGYATGDSPI
jgi:hypothetical protein